jgi:Fe2+ transport system protein FeoA
MPVRFTDTGMQGASEVLPLCEVPKGWRVEVVSYQFNGRRAQRLAEMGLTPGTPIRVLGSARNQPLLVCVRGTHLAIDRQTAESLTVRIIRKVRHGRHHRFHDQPGNDDG